MTATNHALTGAVIATFISEPILAFPLAFLSHFVIDSIPHHYFPENGLFNKKFNTILLTDLAGAALIFFLFIFLSDSKFLYGGCIFLAVVPDSAWAYYRLYLEKIRKVEYNYDFFTRIHARIQTYTNPKFARIGTFNEIGWTVLTISLISLNFSS